MRNKNWAMRLAETIFAASGKPFEWGVHDCCLFVSDCCVAVCGIDPAADYRGRYTSETGAKRALLKLHGSVEGAFDAHFERVPVALAQRGDIVTYVDESGVTAAAVRWAGGYWAALRDGGVGRIECEPVAAWRVES